MKHVIITGGTRGIGAACVEKFSREGYFVSFLYKSRHDKALEITGSLSNVLAIKCDVTSENDIEKAFSRIFEEVGEPDVLVNNAGISYTGLLQEMSYDSWKNVIDTNLSSVFLATRMVIPSMIKRQKGSIINISSMWGVPGASCEVAYSASKSGVIGFTKALALELAPMGVRVNAVAPGVVMTDMLSEYSEEELKELSNATPLGRIGTPEDVANAVYFLAEKGSEFITGEVLNVNGGFVI